VPQSIADMPGNGGSADTDLSHRTSLGEPSLTPKRHATQQLHECDILTADILLAMLGLSEAMK